MCKFYVMPVLGMPSPLFQYFSLALTTSTSPLILLYIVCVLRVLLLAWQAVCPGVVYINRGNHEAISMNKKNGFHRELMEKYDDNILFDFFQGNLALCLITALFQWYLEIFSWLPVATLVSDRVLVLHGGLSAIPDLELEDIRKIPRGNSFQPDDSDLLCDLLWSDPMQVCECFVWFLGQ